MHFTCVTNPLLELLNAFLLPEVLLLGAAVLVQLVLHLLRKVVHHSLHLVFARLISHVV